LKVQIAGLLLVFSSVAFLARSSRADEPNVVRAASGDFAQLQLLMRAAKERAPEVSVAAASLVASRSARESARLASFGNPSLEVTAERGSHSVTKDVAVSGALWLPMELSGQGPSRGREADAFISLHAAFLEQARARAAAQVVRAYGAAVVARQRSAVLSDLLKDARVEAELIAERLKRGDAVRPDAALAAVEAARHEVMLTENAADLARAIGQLAELVGSSDPDTLGPVAPPALEGGRDRHPRIDMIPRSRSLAAEARFHAASAARWRREGRGMFSVGVVAGRGDYGETRLGGGLAYAFPIFRSNHPESARAAAEGSRALAEKNVEEAVASRRLRLLELEQQQLTSALSVLTKVALPAAKDAVQSVKETYTAGKTEMLAVLLSRRELSTLALRRLDLLERSWLLVADYVEITGDLP
jgi:cobalt-zinc-cadmium efflux system outer membrane protein